ncbi:MAG: SGNH/GDSL hydrolase family protein [Chitinophagaceae bacterium]
MNTKQLLIGGLAVLAFAGCKPHLDTQAFNNGGLDFTRYVAVGNSLTAGYANNSLCRSSQMSSYPSILAQQFSAFGGGAFLQPLLKSEVGFPGPKLILGYTTDSVTGVTSLGPIPDPAPSDNAGDEANIAAQGPFNNLGVPGIRAIDFLIPGYGSLNPYAKRFFSSMTARPLAELGRMNPTFFTAWIGNNDVLGYATSGGSGTINGGFLDQNSISNSTLFAVALDSVVNRMTAGGAKGVLLSIPDVTAIPFFTTIPYNGLVLTRQGQVDSLNGAYTGTGITFKLGQNPFIIVDNSVPLIKRRPMVEGEYVCLTVPQASLKAGLGSIQPIPGQYILDATEVGNVRSATATFNGMIAQEAAAHNLAFVNMGAFLSTLSSGILYNGVNYNAQFVTGGAFSLDGVHLTPRGYAFAANEIIRNINAFYGANIPMVDVNAYHGLAFP